MSYKERTTLDAYFKDLQIICISEKWLLCHANMCKWSSLLDHCQSSKLGSRTIRFMVFQFPVLRKAETRNHIYWLEIYLCLASCSINLAKDAQIREMKRKVLQYPLLSSSLGLRTAHFLFGFAVVLEVSAFVPVLSATSKCLKLREARNLLQKAGNS